MENFFRATILQVHGIGAKLHEKLIAYFTSGKAIWEASAQDIRGCEILPEGVRNALIEAKGHKDKPWELAELCQEKGISLCNIEEEAYPELLKEIYQPPPVLYYKGQLVNRPRIAMVGSRQATAYGKSVAESLAKDLAQAGITVVSGCATGIDTYCHRGALQKGITEAVLGNGVDIAYPHSNKKLLEEIALKGGILSEYPPGIAPIPGFFPARNRIISGMSLGTVVVEAAERSGSLITASYALEQSRDVFAVPGNIFSRHSQGCNELIKQGGKLISKVEDILEEYSFLPTQKVRENIDAINNVRAIMTDTEKNIYNILSRDIPLSVDELICKLKEEDTSQVAFILLQMELKGLIRKVEGNQYLAALL